MYKALTCPHTGLWKRPNISTWPQHKREEKHRKATRKNRREKEHLSGGPLRSIAQPSRRSTGGLLFSVAIHALSRVEKSRLWLTTISKWRRRKEQNQTAFGKKETKTVTMCFPPFLPPSCLYFFISSSSFFFVSLKSFLKKHTRTVCKERERRGVEQKEKQLRPDRTNSFVTTTICQVSEYNKREKRRNWNFLKGKEKICRRSANMNLLQLGRSFFGKQ